MKENLNRGNESNQKVLVKTITVIMHIATKYRILLVDDEPDTTLTLKEGLESSGFALVDTFNDPILPLTAFKPGIYDLLLLDI
jgi:PleD family two-component response regulator